MVPSFFVVQIIISFVNPTDEFKSKVIWERAGFQSRLFWLNFVLLLFYVGLFVTAWFLGQFHEDESSELSKFKKAEKRVQEGMMRLETVIELHGADSLDVQTFFHKWRETTDKLRAREDTINRRRLMRTPKSGPKAGSWRLPKHSDPVGSVVAVVGSPDLPRPPSVQKPRFIFDPTRVKWYWEETPERISQHAVVRPPYWVPFDEKAAATLEQAMVQERSLVQLSGGKYVAPQEIEGKVKAECPYLEHVLVHGNARNFCSALVTLDADSMAAWARDHGKEGTSIADLGKLPEVVQMVDEAFTAVNKEMPSYATIKKFEIVPEPFTVETGELTASLKVKRKAVEQKYQNILDSFYAGSLKSV